jgi:ketosteroid isomerase-like protein
MKTLAALLALALFAGTAGAQDAARSPQSAVRAAGEAVIEAVNKADYDAMVALLHPGVVITYQNAEVARGHAEVKAFQAKMTGGPERIVESYHIDVKADDITILPGGANAVSTGSSVETYKMTHGADLMLTGRWTATLVNENGQWLVSTLHCSANLFANPVVEATKKAGVTAGIGSIIIGLVAGWFLGRRKVI